MTTLYQSVLGDRFTTLPPALRRFHARTNACARGHVSVRRGRGLVARLVASIMGLPPASEQLAIELRTTIEDDREVWTRSFASPTGSSVGRPMITRQWREGPLLVEALGLTRTYFELELASEPLGLRFVQRRCTILGVPVPRVLAPRVEAFAWSSDAEGWVVEVHISLPVIGLLVAYAGRMTPED